MANEDIIFTAYYLEHVKTYIASLSVSTQARIAAHIQMMEYGDFQSVHTKSLDGAVRELIIGQHRFSYFLIGKALYLVDGFPKKSAKTPKGRIKYAVKIYKKLKS